MLEQCQPFGRIKVVTSGLPGVDDFTLLSDWSDVAFVAHNSLNELALVRPDGAVQTVLDASNGLASPTSIAVRGNQIYITNAGFAEPHAPKVLHGTIDSAVAGGLKRAAASTSQAPGTGDFSHRRLTNSPSSAHLGSA